MQVSIKFTGQQAKQVTTSMTIERDSRGFYFRLFKGEHNLDDRVCGAYAFISDEEAQVLGAMLSVGKGGIR